MKEIEEHWKKKARKFHPQMTIFLIITSLLPLANHINDVMDRQFHFIFPTFKVFFSKYFESFFLFNSILCH